MTSLPEKIRDTHTSGGVYMYTAEYVHDPSVDQRWLLTFVP